MFSSINFMEMTGFYQLTEADLKDKKYSELEEMQAAMERQKREEKAHTPAFADMVKRYIICFNFLNQWFPEEDIIRATAEYATERVLTEECPVPVGRRCFCENAEFIGTRKVLEHKRDRYGNQLLETEYVRRDIYRIPNQYQGSLCHDKIILSLLYDKYPQLREFDFSAYSWDDFGSEYEIYPVNNVFTPFRALMEKDVEAIKERNLDYCRSYNCREYTVQKVTERLKSDEVQHYFDVIRNL